MFQLSKQTPFCFPSGKVLLIGGGVANFTNVAATFHGIIRAIREYQEALKAHSVQIYVRRGGPNYQEGLRAMQKLGKAPFAYLFSWVIC